MRGGLFAVSISSTDVNTYLSILRALAVRAFQPDPWSAAANRLFQPHTTLSNLEQLNYSIL